MHRGKNPLTSKNTVMVLQNTDDEKEANTVRTLVTQVPADLNQSS